MRMVKELDEEEAAFVPWDALSCLALTLKLCRPIVPSADCTTSVAGVYLAKRRTANHPCPVCGKHYVNEGSLRKHLACHPETSQLSTSLRMWPCSVCQAVFTHESGKYLIYVNANRWADRGPTVVRSSKVNTQFSFILCYKFMIFRFVEYNVRLHQVTLIICIYARSYNHFFIL